MSKGIESRTFLWSSASFKIIKIGILLPLVRRFEMNKWSARSWERSRFYSLTHLCKYIALKYLFMSIYPILTRFNGSWPGSTVQFTAFFIFEKKKEQQEKAGFSIQGILTRLCQRPCSKFHLRGFFLRRTWSRCTAYGEVTKLANLVFGTSFRVSFLK